MNTYSFGNCIIECCTPVLNSAVVEFVDPNNILTVDFTACEPATDFRIFYRPQGSIEAYRDGGTVIASPFIISDDTDAEGTQYEGYIQSECGELLGSPVAFVTSGYGCGDGITDSYSGNDYHLYDTYFLITGTENVHLNYDSFDRPNRFTVYDITTSVQTVTSGWIGMAPYPGPWGLSLSTPETGTISFVAETGHAYKLLVEAGGANPSSPESDTFEISITCD